MKAIIVDDELNNRENLRQLLQIHCPQVTVAACCASAAEARNEILRLDPGLVFLDIEMPGGNGFSLLENLPSPDFEVIFVTAYGHYGIQAVKFSALDYLLKPIDTGELIEAVKKRKRKSHSGRKTRECAICYETVNCRTKTKPSHSPFPTK